MNDEQYVKKTAQTRMVQNAVVGIICLSVDAYLSSTPWASVIIGAVAASCFVTIGYLTGVLRMAEKLTDNK